MIYAQIKNCVVQNVIMVDDESLLPLLQVGFDACQRIDQLDPTPAIGSFYDGETFPAIISQDVVGGIPNDVPSGNDATFTPFSFCDSNGSHGVSIDGTILNIGCQQYDYAWTRYALWMILENGEAQVGPLIKTDRGVSYGQLFNIDLSDIMNLYSNLCGLK